MIEKNKMTEWRSLETRDPDAELSAELLNEFPEGAAEESLTTTSRREFMGVMGAGMAVGAGMMSGCVRKPVEHIYPYSNRPEHTIPGRPKYFATSIPVGGVVSGFLIESHDGRPTKLEGNPDHPTSLGAASAQAQASVLDLYDPERATTPSTSGVESTLADVDTLLAGIAAKAVGNKGEGLALLVESRPSPTYERLLGVVKSTYPMAAIYRDDATERVNARAGMALMGLTGLPFLHVDQATTILAIDSDFIGYEGEAVVNARHFADGRRVVKPGDSMNRLYVIEPTFSITGAMADHRQRCASSDVGGFVSSLVAALAKHGVTVDLDVAALATQKVRDFDEKWIADLAGDLAGATGQSLVVIGERHPAVLHAAVAVINDALGGTGKTVSYLAESGVTEAGTLSDLVSGMNASKVDTLVVLGGNPVYTATGDLDVKTAMAKVATTIVVSSYAKDETAAVATWHVAASHYLESWGDWTASDGTVSVQQPLIAPIFKTRSELEILSALLGKSATSHELVVETWEDRLSGKTWRKALHDGVAVAAKRAPAGTLASAGLNKALAGLKTPTAVSATNLEVNFVLDTKLVDGRNANNGWLQELPDSMTKLTWDNAALMNVKTAGRLGINKTPKRSGVKTYDMVEVSVAGRSVKLAAFISPGLADDTIFLNLGYGRTNGDIATGAGVAVNVLRTQAASAFAGGATVKTVSGRYPLASTQDHWFMGPDPDESPLFAELGERPLVREITQDDYEKHPDAIDHMGVHTPHQENLWPDVQDYSKGQQWGMTIDLNSCTGCNACAIACQSENNISIVRKERVLKGREMHWIRMDRYYRGEPDNPTAVFQPMACVHCENAPCEAVCPVGATAHSPDGMNDMVYNRCVGTRYCSNNCPYKVRRFNYFAYNRDETVTSVNPFLADDEKLSEIQKMQKNPDVTIRFRGVMEKCTYCVQRVNQAKIEAKVTGDGVVKDGDIVPACQQTCPAGAIVFGDQNDPTSRVSILKKQARDYEVLGELNNRARTTYLARLRNPNPAIEKRSPSSHGGDHGEAVAAAHVGDAGHGTHAVDQHTEEKHD